MMDIYLEIGKKRVIAGALEWPGWCRSEKDEVSAVEKLFSYGPRYAMAIESANLDFSPPETLADLHIIEQLEGNAGTDFGVPSLIPSADAAPVSEADLQRFQTLFQAMWRSFDAAVQSAEGKILRLGPRGGGRDLQTIVEHVYGADQSYLLRLGGTLTAEQKKAGPAEGLVDLRQTFLDTLGPAARGELPSVGPRGGKRWGPRFFVRYAAWHLLDHTWEIEDRIL
jgi:hypothetical protein